MTELHRRLDRIEATLARLPATAAEPPDSAQNDHARGGLWWMR